jgi:hypothetical protein
MCDEPKCWNRPNDGAWGPIAGSRKLIREAHHSFVASSSV